MDQASKIIKCFIGKIPERLQLKLESMDFNAVVSFMHALTSVACKDVSLEPAGYLCEECKKEAPSLLHESETLGKFYVQPRYCGSCRKKKWGLFERDRDMNKFIDSQSLFDRFSICKYKYVSLKDMYKIDERRELMRFLGERYLPSFRRKSKGLFLYGGTGVGKTFVVCAVANYLHTLGMTSFFTTVVGLIDRSYGSSYDEKKLIRKLTDECDILVLDDIGSEWNSSFAQELVFRVIDNRYQMDRPIFFTSNKSPEDLRNDRVASRVADFCHTFALDGKDFRRSSS